MPLSPLAYAQAMTQLASTAGKPAMPRMGTGLAQGGADIQSLHAQWYELYRAAQEGEGPDVPQFDQWLAIQGLAKTPGMSR